MHRCAVNAHIEVALFYSVFE